MFSKVFMFAESRNYPYIWRNYDVNKRTDRIPARFPHPPGEPQKLPIVTFFDNFHSRLNRKWCQHIHIRSNPVLRTARVVSAFRKHTKHTVPGFRLIWLIYSYTKRFQLTLITGLFPYNYN